MHTVIWVLLLLTIAVSSIALLKSLRTVDNYLADHGHPDALASTYSLLAANIVISALVLGAVIAFPDAPPALTLTLALTGLVMGTLDIRELLRIKRIVAGV